MKVRIHDQLLRLRLEQNEVNRLVRGQSVDSEMVITQNVLRFSISVDGQGSDAKPGRAKVGFVGGHCDIILPGAWLVDWDTSDLVGFEFESGGELGPKLSVVIEKDYPCAHTKEGKALFGKPRRMD